MQIKIVKTPENRRQFHIILEDNEACPIANQLVAGSMADIGAHVSAAIAMQKLVTYDGPCINEGSIPKEAVGAPPADFILGILDAWKEDYNTNGDCETDIEAMQSGIKNSPLPPMRIIERQE